MIQLFFLDKSARPLSTAFLEEWKQQFGDTPHPQVRFLNIGTEKLPVIVRWAKQNLPDPGEGGKYSIEEAVTAESLTAVFGEENVETIQTVLGNAGSILIVDDLSHSGRSMRLAEAVIHAAKTGVKTTPFFILESPEDKAEFTEKNLPFLPWRGATGVEDPLQSERDPYSQFGNENKKAFIVKPLSQEKTELRSKSRKFRQELRQLMQGKT